MDTPHAFVDEQIPVLAQSLREYLRGEISHTAMAEVGWSVVGAWNALPDGVRQGEPAAHEDVLWHAVWTTQHLADEEHRSEGISDPLLHECLHLLESRMPLPQRYVARRP